VRHAPLIGVITLSLLASACSRSEQFSGKAVEPGLRAAPASRYDMANGCYALQVVASKALTARNGGGYVAKSAAPESAEAFYMKPAALGKYMFHGHDRSLLAVIGGAVGSQLQPSKAAVWTVDRDAQGRFSVVSESAGKALSVSPDGQLVLAATSAAFTFVPVTGCKAFPEMPVDIDGDTYKGQGVDQPVIGFAEVHTHMAMGHEMSGGGGVGPSAGGALYGQLFNNLGVTEALKDCEEWHGPDGIINGDNVVRLGENSANPLNRHDTIGWPTFTDWPSAFSLVHQGGYYKWIERAYKAGLRILVNHGTNIDSLCQVGRAVVSGVKPDNINADCDDMSLGFKQDRYIIEAQDYIDAQEGGPGKGWFRIVKSPAEARQVINDGKLAVILGLEFSNIFNCSVTFAPDGSETDGCDEAEIDKQIGLIWDLGVRQLFPFHDINSALGGTGIFSSDALNALGFYQTRAFWKTYDCPEGGEGDAYFYPAGAVQTTSSPFPPDPVSPLLVDALQGAGLPVYPPGRQCNARGLTDLGRYALTQLMDKGFVIDIDHAELSIKSDMIEMGKARVPQYPFVSGHGGHGGISTQQARDILALGGLIYPYKPNGRGQVEFMNKVRPLWPAGRSFAVGYGSDTNGFGGLAGPRGAGSVPVQYPFKLFEGPGWGPQFAAAGIQPISVGQLTVPESGMTWNVDETGMAHYGMVADFVEETRIEGGEEAITTLYNSAEAYLQMWERTVNR